MQFGHFNRFNVTCFVADGGKCEESRGFNSFTSPQYFSYFTRGAAELRRLTRRLTLSLTTDKSATKEMRLRGLQKLEEAQVLLKSGKAGNGQIHWGCASGFCNLAVSPPVCAGGGGANNTFFELIKSPIKVDPKKLPKYTDGALVSVASCTYLLVATLISLHLLR